MQPIRKRLVLASAVLATLGCGGNAKEEADPAKATSGGVMELTTAQVASAGLTFAVTEQRDGADVFTLPGTLEPDPQRSWRVSPPVAGVIEELGVVASARVKKGQLLARLKSVELGEAEAAWLQAHTEVRFAKAERDRNEALRKNQIISEAQWLKVDTDHQRAVAALAQTERRLSLAGLSGKQLATLGADPKQLGRLTISSPGDGVVIASSLRRGQAIAAGETAFEIADLSELWLTVHLPARLLSQLAPGVNVTVRVEGAPKAYTGQLASFGASVLPSDQTVDGRVFIVNEGAFLRPGMFAEVDVAARSVRALMVPAGAVINVGNKTYVFQKVDATHFQPVQVTAGPPLGEWVPLTGPSIGAGVAVVVGGLAELKSHWLYTQ